MVGICYDGDPGEAGLVIKVAHTHAESNWFGELCVRRGLRHLGFVHSMAHPAVQDMKSYMWEGKIICQSHNTGLVFQKLHKCVTVTLLPFMPSLSLLVCCRATEKTRAW